MNIDLDSGELYMLIQATKDSARLYREVSMEEEAQQLEAIAEKLKAHQRPLRITLVKGAKL